MADDNDSHESMGDYSMPKSMMMGPGGPGGPIRGVVYVDRSKMKGAGMNPLAGRYVESPFADLLSRDDSKTFKETYEETRDDVRRKHKWLAKPLLDILISLSSIPRHLLRNSIQNTSYSPKNVAHMEAQRKNKL